MKNSLSILVLLSLNSIQSHATLDCRLAAQNLGQGAVSLGTPQFSSITFHLDITANGEVHFKGLKGGIRETTGSLVLRQAPNAMSMYNTSAQAQYLTQHMGIKNSAAIVPGSNGQTLVHIEAVKPKWEWGATQAEPVEVVNNLRRLEGKSSQIALNEDSFVQRSVIPSDTVWNQPGMQLALSLSHYPYAESPQSEIIMRRRLDRIAKPLAGDRHYFDFRGTAIAVSEDGHFALSPRVVSPTENSDYVNAKPRGGVRQIIILDQKMNVIDQLSTEHTAFMLPVESLSMDSQFIYAFGYTSMNASRVVIISRKTKQMVMQLMLPSDMHSFRGDIDVPFFGPVETDIFTNNFRTTSVRVENGQVYLQGVNNLRQKSEESYVINLRELVAVAMQKLTP